jgi:hypothetical protein
MRKSVALNHIRFPAALMRFSFSFLLFALFPIAIAMPVTGFAQLIVSRTSEPQATDPRFNPALIKANKIRRITLNIADKPDLQVIIDRGLVQCCEFDTSGHMSMFYTTSLKGQEKTETFIKPIYKKGRKIRAGYTEVAWTYVYDTSFTWLRYDNDNRLIMKRTNYGDFFSTYYYDYDKEGRLIKEVNCKETNKNMDLHAFELGVQTVLSTESFEYIPQSPTQVKKLCYNDDGKVYKQGIINSDNNTVQEDYSFVVGYVRYGNTYKYDNSGKIIEKTNVSNSNGDVKLTTLYTYDENGNVMEEKNLKNDTQTNLVAWLYDESKKLVTTRLDRDFIHASIQIVKFTYEFYP